MCDDAHSRQPFSTPLLIAFNLNSIHESLRNVIPSDYSRFASFSLSWMGLSNVAKLNVLLQCCRVAHRQHRNETFTPQSDREKYSRQPVLLTQFASSVAKSYRSAWTAKSQFALELFLFTIHLRTGDLVVAFVNVNWLWKKIKIKVWKLSYREGLHNTKKNINWIRSCRWWRHE